MKTSERSADGTAAMTGSDGAQGAAADFGDDASRARKRLRLGRVSPLLPPAFALIEMAILVAVVLAEYLWEGFPSLTRMNPHPYWIAILLLSLQYGTVSGLMAAGIAIVGTVLIGMPEPDIEERYFNYLIRVWTQPVLWLLVAMVLGAFRARQIEQRDELRQTAENLRIRGATLLDHATNLRARCAMLERRIAVRETADTGKLLAALSRLGDGEPGRWAQALDDALAAGFPKAQISVYAVDGGQARLVLSHQRAGQQGVGALAQAEIPTGHPLFTAVVGQGRSVSVIAATDDDALRGMGVAAVPVIDGVAEAGAQRVIGILKADVLPPSQIDGATTRRLAVVAEHLAPALQRGLVLAVGDAGAAAASGTVTGSAEDGVAPVRKWRLLKWLPGGRSTATTSPDGAHD